MIHSYSSLDCYQNCPRQMYERYITKSAPFVDTPETLAGKADHKALEKRLLHDVPLPVNLTQCEPICASLEARAIPQLEVKMGVDRNCEEAGFWDGDVYIRGVLDLALYNPTFTSVFIGDWKTGKNREAQKEPLQLMIFAAFVFSYYKELQSVMATNIYTKTGQMGHVHSWQRSELPELWRTIIPLVHEVEAAEASGYFPEKPSGLCGWCPVFSCSHNRVKQRAPT